MHAYKLSHRRAHADTDLKLNVYATLQCLLHPHLRLLEGLCEETHCTFGSCGVEIEGLHGRRSEPCCVGEAALGSTDVNCILNACALEEGAVLRLLHEPVDLAGCRQGCQPRPQLLPNIHADNLANV